MKTIFTTAILFIFSVAQLIAQTDSLPKSSEVILFTKSGNIHGSLMIPASPKPMPVVLFIAGSGPTDRDGNNVSMKNNSLKLLATELYQNQIASLRFDKRGIAESRDAGENEKDLRFDDYIQDAEEWIKLLKSDHRFSKVIVLGHSEGSLIGMIAAERAEALGFISVAGAGQPADQILRQQLRGQPMNVVAMCNQVLDSLVQGRMMSKIDPSLNTLFRPAIQPYLISWFKYDPAAEIKKLKTPVLILQGTTDIQVSVKDAELLAAANPAASYMKIEGMNHVLKAASADRTQNLSMYNDPLAPVKPELVQEIVNFIMKIK
ncbi:alpha/beta hydrolase [soil metagenome]